MLTDRSGQGITEYLILGFLILIFLVPIAVRFIKGAADKGNAAADAIESLDMGP